ncbi:MAG: hypothetical protein D6753_05910 [Planctomycetota bacterium]|nr:MAG: hypothetical protein D6753_05910 [Planctomycetota bacterium]
MGTLRSADHSGTVPPLQAGIYGSWKSFRSPSPILWHVSEKVETQNVSTNDCVDGSGGLYDGCTEQR